SGKSVLVIERSEPGREASHAAAGMLAPHGGDLPDELSELATASAAMYPEFVRELEDEATARPHEPHAPPIDLRSQGTLLIGYKKLEGARSLSGSEVSSLEPHLASAIAGASYIHESSVDPRGLIAALVRSLQH